MSTKLEKYKLYPNSGRILFLSSMLVYSCHYYHYYSFIPVNTLIPHKYTQVKKPVGNTRPILENQKTIEKRFPVINVDMRWVY